MSGRRDERRAIMNRILVLYGTSEGHTRKIADAMGDAMRAHGLDVDVIEAAGSVDPKPSTYGGIIVAASVHGGVYQKPVGEWLRAHAVELRQMPTAFVSVCLSILSKNEAGRQEAEAIPRRFLDSVRWQPTIVKIVAGALLYRQYNFVIRWVMKRIVASAGGDTDTSRDYEYTDWNDIRVFARDFAHRVATADAA
jgi:menaquinone-dependent protoporphyrinogen oxidase